MKRVLVILGLLALMFDLADDGCVGKAKLVAPQHSSGIVELLSDSPAELASVVVLSEFLLNLPGSFQYQPVPVKVFHPCKASYSCSFFSSGGIPS